ncbi:MAG: hypothetical protein AAFP76_00525 [Bacteroidota bacterium]
MEDKRRKNARIYLIVSSIVLGLGLLPSLGMAMFSPMMFDSPGSENNWITVAIVICLISFPVFVVLCTPVAWFLFVKKKALPAVGVVSIPYLIGIALITLFVLLEVLCDGRFNC